jgi:excisionase family DNA binding protein
MSKDEHLSLGKVAKRCNVSRTTVYRWTLHGHLKAYTLPSGHLRVKPEDLDDFCQSFGIPDIGKKSARISSANAGKLQVLIADDHPDVVLLLRKVVERYLPNAVIHEAINGVDTCITVGTIKPHILLLDIMMPGMDGFAVLEELLRRPELTGSQVVIISAYEPFDRVEEMGRLHPKVAATVRKPVSVDSLGHCLQDLARTFSVG